ncbi:MAG: cytochrome b/b6 domain-containing protein [Pseudomonadota bacterium]
MQTLTTPALGDTEVDRYAFVQRLLHWMIALLVLGALAGGALLWYFGFQGLSETFGQPLTGLIYKYHKTAGVLILALMAVRVALRFTLGAPAQHASIPEGQARIAVITHIALYAMLVIMPIAGWVGTAAGGFPVEFFDAKLPGIVGKDKALSEAAFRLHGILGLAIGALVILHIGAALRHWLVLKDGVMRRIGLP